MSTKTVFVTVGTTKFDKLIETVDESVDVIKNLGYTHINYQIGNGRYWPSEDRLITTCFRFKNSIDADIQSADLVISHAGAGTCLEVLKSKKPLLVVVNESLMDNHQTELAEQLAKQQYISYCYCSTLRDTLLTMDSNKLKVFEGNSIQSFVQFLDNEVMNFSV